MLHGLEGEDNHARPAPGDPSDGWFDLSPGSSSVGKVQASRLRIPN